MNDREDEDDVAVLEQPEIYYVQLDPYPRLLIQAANEGEARRLYRSRLGLRRDDLVPVVTPVPDEG
jgi:hypothetical protein